MDLDLQGGAGIYIESYSDGLSSSGTDARYRAVARRFAKVMWWNDAKELVVLKNPGEQRDTQEWEDARVAWNHPALARSPSSRG